MGSRDTRSPAPASADVPPLSRFVERFSGQRASKAPGGTEDSPAADVPASRHAQRRGVSTLAPGGAARGAREQVAQQRVDTALKAARAAGVPVEPMPSSATLGQEIGEGAVATLSLPALEALTARLSRKR